MFEIGASIQAAKTQLYDMTVKSVNGETSRAVTLVLEPSNKKIQLFFKSGQYLNIYFVIDGKEYCRSYSISSAPYEEDISITVQAIDDGVVSNFVNESVSLGDVVRCTQPAGDFILHNMGRPKIFFAAGSGITPIFSMIKNHLYMSNQTCFLYYLNSSSSSTIFFNDLSSLCNIYSPRFYVLHWHTEVNGRFDFDLHKLKYFDVAVSLPSDVYICGPAEWMRRMQKSLSAEKHRLGKVYVENFVSNNVESSEKNSAAMDEVVYQVSIDISNCKYMFEARNTESLLEAIQRHTIPVTSGCKMGKCGACMVKVTSGDVKMRKVNFLTQEEIDDGYILCCQSSVNSDCQLEA